MKKEVISRLLIGFPCGILIAQFLTILFSMIIDGSSYHPITPELLSVINNEIFAVALQSLLSGILGSICLVSSLIWEIDEWSLTKQFTLNFIIICTCTVIIASILKWFSLTWMGLLLFIGVFIVVYFLIWLISYLFYRIQIIKINEKLKRG